MMREACSISKIGKVFRLMSRIRKYWLAFRWGKVVSGPGSNLQILRLLSNHRHFDFVIAGHIGIRWRVAERVLRMQLSANFVDSVFDGAVLERGEVRAS